MSSLPVRRLRKWIRIARKVGLRRAFFDYVREGLPEDERTRAHVDAVSTRVDATSAHLEAMLSEARARADHADAKVEALLGRLDESARLGDERERARSAELESLRTALAEARARSELLQRIFETTRWAELAVLANEPTISIVLPTRNRPGRLPTAVASVLAQTYPNWELLVVDDAREGEATVDASAFTDPRIRVLRSGGTGHSAARNLAIDHARGSLVAYLDDDNQMFPAWLKAVAWCFETHPEVDMLYGARLIDRPGAWMEAPLAPTLHFEPFDRDRLCLANYVDTGTIAHRTGLSEGRFDETLAACVDWDLALRLTKDKPAFTLPVLASAYSTSQPGRISTTQKSAQAFAEIRSRLQAG